MLWIEALKIYNKGQQWCVPKKGSPEHAEVMKIMKGSKVESTPTPTKKSPDDMEVRFTKEQLKEFAERRKARKTEKEAKVSAFMEKMKGKKKEKVKAFLKGIVEKKKAEKEKEGRLPLTASNMELTKAKGYDEVMDVIKYREEQGIKSGKSYLEILKSIDWPVDFLNEFAYGMGVEYALEAPFRLIARLKERDKGKTAYYDRLLKHYQSVFDKYSDLRDYTDMVERLLKDEIRMEEIAAKKKEKREKKKEGIAAAGIPQGKANAKVFTKAEYIEALKASGFHSEKAERDIPEGARVEAYLARTKIHRKLLK